MIKVGCDNNWGGSKTTVNLWFYYIKGIFMVYTDMCFYLFFLLYTLRFKGSFNQFIPNLTKNFYYSKYSNWNLYYLQYKKSCRRGFTKFLETLHQYLFMKPINIKKVTDNLTNKFLYTGLWRCRRSTSKIIVSVILQLFNVCNNKARINVVFYISFNVNMYLINLSLLISFLSINTLTTYVFLNNSKRKSY